MDLASLLIEEGALSCVVQNAKTETAAIRQHIELALCHLAQHGKCVLTYTCIQHTDLHQHIRKRMVKEGAIWGAGKDHKRPVREKT